MSFDRDARDKIAFNAPAPNGLLSCDTGLVMSGIDIKEKAGANPYPIVEKHF